MKRHGDKVREAALDKGAAAKSALAASWSRSLLMHKLDPDGRPMIAQRDESDLAGARERMGALAFIAAPILDRLFAAFGDFGCSVVLTDRSGLIVERRGKAGDDESFRAWGLWTGVDWSEAAEGTNGIGTCLVEQRPIAIHRDQHFYSQHAGLSCMGAPVFDHEGELAGVLDLSSCRADFAETFTPLLSHAVAQAARQIEAENFQAAFAHSRIIMGPGAQDSGPVLLAADADDLLIGATRRARKTFGLSAQSFASPKPVRDILSADAPAADLDGAERAELRRALAHANGNAAQAARDLGISRATLYRRMAKVGLR
jgi:transcriptional regulator of acetoin/glycerol metabolism